MRNVTAVPGRLGAPSGYRLRSPSALTAAGGHIWVANYDGGVTELDARDGRWVRTLSSTRYGFNDPRSIAAAGNHAWVANLYPYGVGAR